ncbi:hypothetical protein BUALT_Bualt19G0123100 [Buddleja alternifolia]|uniref:30S ribosomal protein S31, mitochondrial n=1 Tax=Buddleja alternifolia TaxID=168488 RepID=A0AAV6WAL9_9LAMI|nr:hypothetical protein BUALT_Bualt19G0123100 [Buddleja alternifolia]
MAMIQRCATAAVRRITAAFEQRMSFSSVDSSMKSPLGAPIVCGRGDKKTKKGKRFKGSYGNARPKKEKQVERIKDRIECSLEVKEWLSEAWN